MRVLFCFLALSFCSCSSSAFNYHSPGPYEGGVLLGNGTYMTEVRLEPRHGEPLRFNAVFARKPGGTVFAALSPSGKPFFTVLDKLIDSEVPGLRTFAAEPALTKELATSFYEGFRPLLLLDDKMQTAQPFVKERHPDGRPRLLSAAPGFELLINEYDWEGHAFRLTLEHGDWIARISLREYEMKK